MQSGNGKWESTQFNPRLQPTQIALGTVQNGTDKLKLNYDYGTTNNNGNVLSQQITVPTTGTYQGFTATQTYTYDSLNRLKQATETIPTLSGWQQTFTYDRYGNRNFDTNNTTTLGSCAQNVCNPTVNTANNRLNGYGYDSAGNVTTDAQGGTFTYDAENKQTQVVSNGQAVGQYFYDGDGKRVKKVNPQSGETTIFVYDAGGKMVAEYSTIAPTTAKVSYLTSDHLGSPRINTNEKGDVFARHDYLPFGEEISSSISPVRNINLQYGDDGIKKKFTAYERDTESGLDYAKARMFGSSLGRFTSPDEFRSGPKELFILGSGDSQKQALPYAEINNPQSLNKYVYCYNNPLRFVDSDGHLASPWHFLITFAAGLKTHHGFFGSLKLAWKNAAVDFRKGSQDTDATHTNMHAMRGTKPDGSTQSPEEAQAATAQVITDAMKKEDTALAGHDAIDAATPGHNGKIWRGFGHVGFLKHGLGDLIPSPKTINQAYKNEKAVLEGTNPLSPTSTTSQPQPTAPSPQSVPPPAQPPGTDQSEPKEENN